MTDDTTAPDASTTEGDDWPATDDDRLAAYFAEERPVRSVGAVYDPGDEHGRLHDSYRLPEAFDGLVFVADASQSRPVERECAVAAIRSSSSPRPGGVPTRLSQRAVKRGR